MGLGNAAIVAMVVVTASASPAARADRVLPGLRFSGDWRVAVAGTDNCPTGDDGADSMPIAWVAPPPSGNVTNATVHTPTTFFITSVSQGVHPMVGTSLTNLTRQCGKPIFNSTFTEDPSTYANWQWLQSTRVLRNGTG
jgi:hypothetical protein